MGFAEMIIENIKIDDEWIRKYRKGEGKTMLTKEHQVIGTAPCGCKVIKHPDQKMNPFIDYCSKHKAAPAMYQALKTVLTCLESIIPSDLVAKSAKTTAAKVIIKALAKADGKEV